MKFFSNLLFTLILLSGVLHAQTLSPEETNDQNEFTDAPEDFTPKIPNQTIPWQPPNYSEQKNALGWKVDVFVPPTSMQARVNFWTDIYAKYNTSQGVLHDLYYVDIVYDQVDFQDIRADKSKTPRMQKKAIEKLIKDKRHTIQDRLVKLSKLANGEGLTGEDLRYWNMFLRLHDKNRFVDAANQSRIRFQLGQSDRFLQGIFYSGRYLKQMEHIFREEGLPIELTRLPFVESSFNIFARSKVGASGVWQFMRRTAKLYMKVNASVDERNDPLRAARSAARMLRQNYQFLGNWPLAITGWNHGPNGVKKIVKKLGTDDLSKIVSIYSSNRFGFASENFYASFLAALYVESHANQFFTNIKWSRELENEEVKLTRALPFAMLKLFFDADLDRTLLLNPQFQNPVRKGSTPIPVGSYVHIPKTRSEVMKKYLNENLSSNELTKQLAELAKNMPIDGSANSSSTPISSVAANQIKTLPPVVATPIQAPPPPAEVEGEKKNAIVEAAATPVPTAPIAIAATPSASSITEIKSSAAPIFLSQIPVPPVSQADAKVAISSSATQAPDSEDGAISAQTLSNEAQPTEYKVRRGDNFTRIAKRLHFRVSKLLEANPEMAEAKLMPGMKIKLPQK